jgi:multiple sugar transport system ATP-binding protein
VRDGQNLTFGLRLEHVTLGRGGKARVVVEPTAAETHLTLDLGGVPLTVVTRDRPAIVPGGSILIDLESAASHLFDAEIGRRL